MDLPSLVPVRRPNLRVQIDSHRSPQRPPGRAPQTAGPKPASASTSIRHVNVTASTHTRAFEDRGQPALLATESIQKPERVVHGQIFAEVGEGALDRFGLGRSGRTG